MKKQNLSLVNVLTISVCFLALPLMCAAQGKIAFSSSRDGNSEIYIMDPDGSNQTRLTNNPGSDRSPSLSFDGTKIAFVSDRDGQSGIFVMNSDGTNPTRVTDSPLNADPAISPNGSKIAFDAPNLGDDYGIYVINVDGTGRTQLTNYGEDPAFSPDGSRITFADPYGYVGVRGIYVMNANGSNPFLLPVLGIPSQPAFSPDGSKIVFTFSFFSVDTINVINTDGTNPVTLEPGEDPSFSPDGSKIVFGSGEIVVMNSDGSNRVNLTDSGSHPSWGGTPDMDTDGDGVPVAMDNCSIVPNPDQANNDGDAHGDVCDADDDNDGQSDTGELACASDPLNAASISPDDDSDNIPDCVDPDDDNDGVVDSRDNCPSTPNPEKIAFISSLYVHAISVMNADGSNQTQLTSPFGDPNVPRSDSNPSISADGSKIAFLSDRDYYYIGEPQNKDIYVMNADGSNQTRLTNNPADEGEPSISGDGSKIVFMSDRDGPGNDQIYVMNGDGSNQTRLTNNLAIDSNPSISADGSKIAFRSQRAGDSPEIYIMNVDGTNQTRLTNNMTDDYQPSFSPDGSKIVFASNRDDNSEIYVMNADGSNQIRLTNSLADESDPAFSPDGIQIAFLSLRFLNPGIYVMNADGSGYNNFTLTGFTAFGVEPSWGGRQADSDGDGIGDACEVPDDTTPPVVTPSVIGTLGNNGWFTSNVGVSWTVTDAESDVSSQTGCAVQNLTADSAGVTFTCSATSAGGTTSESVTVKRDATAPTLNPIVSPNPVSLGGSATASANAADALSGIASQSCGAPDTSTAGSKTVHCTATDLAGNTANATAGYTVNGPSYNFTGFFQPVDNLPVVNEVKAGSSIPVKFSLGGNFGLNIFATGYPASGITACNNSTPADAIEETVNAGGSSLTYDAATNQYHYVWKTDRNWKGQCRMLIVKLNDGNTYIAQFRFK